MSKHTPGPWEALFDEATSVRERRHNGARVAICSQTTLRSRRSSEEVAANARLIAAAPDMLEVLKEVYAQCESHDPTTEAFPPTAITMLALRAVIAKAEGRE